MAFDIDSAIAGRQPGVKEFKKSEEEEEGVPPFQAEGEGGDGDAAQVIDQLIEQILPEIMQSMPGASEDEVVDAVMQVIEELMSGGEGAAPAAEEGPAPDEKKDAPPKKDDEKDDEKKDDEKKDDEKDDEKKDDKDLEDIKKSAQDEIDKAVGAFMRSSLPKEEAAGSFRKSSPAAPDINARITQWQAADRVERSSDLAKIL